METEQLIKNEFETYFANEAKKIETKIELNLDAVYKLKEINSRGLKFTIEDVTPIGYGN